MSDTLYGLTLAEDGPGKPWAFTGTDVLTRETLYAAIEKVSKTVEYTVCYGSNKHCVHPADWDRGGLAVCGNCGTVVDLGPRP